MIVHGDTIRIWDTLTTTELALFLEMFPESDVPTNTKDRARRLELARFFRRPDLPAMLKLARNVQCESKRKTA